MSYISYDTTASAWYFSENVLIVSYVTNDKKKTNCIYDAPSPEAIRKSAQKNGLPVDNNVEVSVLDPYFYK